jgi:hypothetical protein
MSQWRTDEPELDRWIVTRIGMYYQINDWHDAETLAREAKNNDRIHAWRYIHGPDELGARVACLLAFVRYVVPMGLEQC